MGGKRGILCSQQEECLHSVTKGKRVNNGIAEHVHERGVREGR